MLAGGLGNPGQGSVRPRLIARLWLGDGDAQRAWQHQRRRIASSASGRLARTSRRRGNGSVEERRPGTMAGMQALPKTRSVSRGSRSIALRNVSLKPAWPQKKGHDCTTLPPRASDRPSGYGRTRRNAARRRADAPPGHHQLHPKRLRRQQRRRRRRRPRRLLHAGTAVARARHSCSTCVTSGQGQAATTAGGLPTARCVCPCWRRCDEPRVVNIAVISMGAV